MHKPFGQKKLTRNKIGTRIEVHFLNTDGQVLKQTGTYAGIKFGGPAIRVAHGYSTFEDSRVVRVEKST